MFSEFCKDPSQVTSILVKREWLYYHINYINFYVISNPPFENFIHKPLICDTCIFRTIAIPCKKKLALSVMNIIFSWSGGYQAIRSALLKITYSTSFCTASFIWLLIFLHWCGFLMIWKGSMSPILVVRWSSESNRR